MPRRKKFPVTRSRPVDAVKVQLAKAMRHDMTCEESILWERLRRSALEGQHFHRQQIIAGFIVDFYCAASSLAIEIDGPIHETQTELDGERDGVLAELGIKTLRIRNAEVANDLDAVLRKIAAACRKPNP